MRVYRTGHPHSHPCGACPASGGFRTRTDPEAPEIVEAIRASLPDRVT